MEWSAHVCIYFRPLATDLSYFLLVCFTASSPSVLSLHDFVGVVDGVWRRKNEGWDRMLCTCKEVLFEYEYVRSTCIVTPG